jgi:hypothetical protein
MKNIIIKSDQAEFWQGLFNFPLIETCKLTEEIEGYLIE